MISDILVRHFVTTLPAIYGMAYSTKLAEYCRWDRFGEWLLYAVVYALRRGIFVCTFGKSTEVAKVRRKVAFAAFEVWSSLSLFVAFVVVVRRSSSFVRSSFVVRRSSFVVRSFVRCSLFVEVRTFRMFELFVRSFVRSFELLSPPSLTLSSLLFGRSCWRSNFAQTASTTERTDTHQPHKERLTRQQQRQQLSDAARDAGTR